MLYLMAQVLSCNAEHPFGSFATWNLGEVHLRIISSYTDWENVAATSLYSVHVSSNAVFSIKTYPGGTNGSNELQDIHQNVFELYCHRRLSLVYYFFTNANNLIHFADRVYDETEQTFPAIVTIFSFAIPSRSGFECTHGNCLTGISSQNTNGQCRIVKFFQMKEVLRELAYLEDQCLQFNMFESLKHPSALVPVLTDVPQQYIKCGLNQMCQSNRNS